MTYRKGEMTPKRVDREFPYQVELAIPEGGLKNIRELDAFCRGRGFVVATRRIGKRRRERGSDAVRYCFADPAHADAFLARFGGDRVALPAKKPPALSIRRRGLWSKWRERG